MSWDFEEEACDNLRRTGRAWAVVSYDDDIRRSFVQVGADIGDGCYSRMLASIDKLRDEIMRQKKNSEDWS